MVRGFYECIFNWTQVSEYCNFTMDILARSKSGKRGLFCRVRLWLCTCLAKKGNSKRAKRVAAPRSCTNILSLSQISWATLLGGEGVSQRLEDCSTTRDAVQRSQQHNHWPIATVFYLLVWYAMSLVLLKRDSRSWLSRSSKRLSAGPRIMSRNSPLFVCSISCFYAILFGRLVYRT
jgi:hypothetical protein